MNGIFIHHNSDPEKEASGEIKKVRMQISAMVEEGLKVKEFCIDHSSPVYKIIRRIPFYPSNGLKFNHSIKRLQLSNFDFIYIRKYMIDWGLIRLLKAIKRTNPKIKIVFEIPTYPYDLEWNRLVDQTMLWKEKICRRFLHKYVDRIVTFSDDKEIWGIETIPISNGIDIKCLPKKRILSNKKEVQINLLAVALLAPWHGYDRLINGLFEYYKNPQEVIVYLNIVGTGPEYKNLQQLVKNYGLNNVVKFYGKLHGEDLSHLYNVNDLAIGSLGMHRIGLHKAHTLKVREYCAIGIPFIKSYYDNIFDNNHFKYMLNVSEDESYIDIKNIITFYNRLGMDKRKIDEMHNFALNYLTWNKQLRPVIEYINR